MPEFSAFLVRYRRCNEGGNVKSLTLVFVVAFLATSPARAQVNCRTVGTQTSCDNGQVFQRKGNQTYDNWGNSWQRSGNQTFGSNGSTYQQFGNQTFDNKGHSWQSF